MTADTLIDSLIFVIVENHDDDDDAPHDAEYADYEELRDKHCSGLQERLKNYLRRPGIPGMANITIDGEPNANYDVNDPLFRTRLFLHAITSAKSLPLTQWSDVRSLLKLFAAY